MDLQKLKPETLDSLLQAHERFAKGHRGGNRLNLQFFDAAGMNFANRDLRQANMVGGNFRGCLFRFAKLATANFYGADLEGADLSSTDLTRSDLRGARLRGANLEFADLTGADIRDGRLLRPDAEGNLVAVTAGGAVTEKAHMSHAKLIGAKLGRAFSQHADLSHANLANAKLVDADLSNCDLRGTIFVGADLTNTNMSNCKLSGAVLAGAMLNGTVFENSDLAGAFFRSADMRDAKMRGAQLPRSLESLEKPLQAILREHQSWTESMGLKGKRADFSRVDISGAKLHRLELSAALFVQSTMVETDLSFS
ncbi:pentapeptide repeat-containing protein, partial [Ferrovibrio sp.]|uniref:pentapeptide repeat-containing protein n=1 Tax=Ferrovibrio sp. TaxID=1917215 RepID=UPI001B5A8616